MARRSEKKKPKATTKRNYPRTARLNTLLQQISADFLERVDDDRVPFLTVTGVEVDADLNKAQIFISTFEDESADVDILKALADHRRSLQSEIAQQARLRKTPEVVFLFDPAVREGARIESILSDLNLSGDSGSDDSGSGESGPDESASSESASSESASSGPASRESASSGSESGDSASSESAS